MQLAEAGPRLTETLHHSVRKSYAPCRPAIHLVGQRSQRNGASVCSFHLESRPNSMSPSDRSAYQQTVLNWMSIQFVDQQQAAMLH